MQYRSKNLFLTSLLGSLLLIGLSWFSKSSKPALTKQERIELAHLDSLRLQTETFRFIDSSRNREIPYVLYRPSKVDSLKPVKVVVFSHGYGKNFQRNYLGYTFITKYLAQRGFWVLSIQHELPNDEPLAFGPNLFEDRYPMWVRGMESIRATIAHFKKNNPNVIVESVDLVGHSNGGDMSVLAATKYPSEFRKVIALDNLRCPYPLQVQPKFLTLRSSDKTADEGVIPPKTVCDSLGLKVVQLKKIKHNDMTDYSLSSQKKQIMRKIIPFLKNN